MFKGGIRILSSISLLIIIAFLAIGCSDKESSKIKEIDYEIISRDDVSTGEAVRLLLNVVVNEETSIEELELISKEVVSELKKDIDFNAVSVQFYDYKEYIGYGYTLGEAIYAPNGKWEDANTTSAGNYKDMDYDFKFRVKDWSNRLTKEEVSIFVSWHELVMDDVPEEDATKQISEQFNISEDKVTDTITKQVMWTFEDNK